MILISIISFVFDGIISVILSENSILLPLFSLVSLIVIYPYLKNKEKIILYGLIIGLLYDLVYTQTLFFNTIIFSVLALIILLFYKYLPINIINSVLLMVIVIVLFRISTYLTLVVVGKLLFNWNDLFASIYCSLLGNIIYLVLISFLLKKIMNKKKQRKQSLYDY